MIFFQAIKIFIFNYFIHLHAFWFCHAFFHLQIKHSTFSQFVLSSSSVCHHFPLFFQHQPNWRHLLLLSIAKCYGSQQWRGRTTNRTGRLSDRVSFCSCCSLRALMQWVLRKIRSASSSRAIVWRKRYMITKKRTPLLRDWKKFITGFLKVDAGSFWERRSCSGSLFLPKDMLQRCVDRQILWVSVRQSVKSIHWQNFNCLSCLATIGVQWSVLWLHG